MDSVQLNVLGRFEALDEAGSTIALSSKKAQALLGYLTVESARPHSRDELAVLLWGDMNEERSRHNLRQTLSKIRQVISDKLLTTDGDAIALDRAHCEADLWSFEAFRARSDAESRRRALELYRHDLLTGLITREDAFDDWLRDARVVLHNRACQTMQTLATELEQQGRHEEALQLYQRRLTFDPACEEAHRGVMIALDREGRRSDALRQYAECVEALARHLRTEPGPQTVECYERIRSARQAPSPPPPPAPGPRRDAPAPAPSAEPPALAVLPFVHLGSDEGERYFTDGIAEDITTELSRFGTLLVVARASAFKYRDPDPDLDEVSRDLGVQYVVQGSVRRSGDRVRISLQLVDVESKAQVWGQRFDRLVEDVFEVQDEVTSTVVSTLAGRIEAAQREHARRIAPEHLDAYHCVLRGKDHHHRYTTEDCDRAIELFRDAIKLDPDYALAHAWLACGLGQGMVFFPDRRRAYLDEAEVSAERGRHLDDDESECYRILAQVCLLRGRLDQALSHQQRALRLNPNNDQIVCAMGEVLSYLGRNEEAAQWVRRAMRLNPYHPDGYWTHLGRALFNLEDFEAADEALRRITRPRVSDQVLQAAVKARRGEDASALRDEVLRRRPDFTVAAYMQATALQPESDRTRLREALETAGF
jgi:adenylate cyclase